jgi:hypothetical protein
LAETAVTLGQKPQSGKTEASIEMKKSVFPFFLIVAAYIGFEAYALKKTAYRVEPLYLYGLFVGAGRAAERCAEPSSDQRRQFARNLDARVVRTNRALRKDEPGLSDDQAFERLAAVRDEREREVDALVAQRGCNDPGVKAWLKRYEFRSTRRLG